MNLDSLRAGLHDLAGAAQPVDLHDRAVRTSHRIARTRLALVAAATVAVVAVTSAGFALGHDDRALPDIATTPSPSTGALPPGTRSAVYVDGLDGLDGQGSITVWTDDAVRFHDVRTNGIGRYSGDEVQESLTVSPDGTRLSWTTQSGIHLARVGDDDMFVLPREDADASVDGSCLEPEWSSDSTRLFGRMWTRETQRIGWFSIDEGSFTAVPDEQWGCDVRINGDWAAFTDMPQVGRFDQVVRNLRTGETRVIPDPSGNETDFEIVSISADGRRITARLIDNEQARVVSPPRTLAADLVIEVSSGMTLPLDTGGRAVRQLFFLADGNLVARVGDEARSSLLIIAPDGRVVSQAEEPVEVREATLLRLVLP
ncbi:hypothetical protein ACIA8K_15085 [Catenuloplanes sp. NPDC051500]|uniref:hypothetical protein n=1 Tax=Catenuloplanes sp. NPDC051500 TaxID=3363959 RepID=UPI00378E627B